MVLLAFCLFAYGSTELRHFSALGKIGSVIQSADIEHG